MDSNRLFAFHSSWGNFFRRPRQRTCVGFEVHHRIGSAQFFIEVWSSQSTQCTSWQRGRANGAPALIGSAWLFAEVRLRALLARQLPRGHGAERGELKITGPEE